MKYFIYLFLVFGLIFSSGGMEMAFAKDKSHGKHDGGDHKAVQVKHDHHPAKGNYFQPARIHEGKPTKVKYVTSGKPRFYSPYYIYSPYYSPVVVSSGFFTPVPKVLVSPTIFTPAVVEPTVPTYYFFPPLYVPPRSLFSFNFGL